MSPDAIASSIFWIYGIVIYLLGCMTGSVLAAVVICDGLAVRIGLGKRRGVGITVQGIGELSTTAILPRGGAGVVPESTFIPATDTPAAASSGRRGPASCSP